jgi:hypothetical protein
MQLTVVSFISDLSPTCALVLAGTVSPRSRPLLMAFLQRHILLRSLFTASLV